MEAAVQLPAQAAGMRVVETTVEKTEHVAKLTEFYQIGKIKFDVLMCRAYINDKIVEFTPTQYRILFILVMNAGSVVSRKEIIDKLWPNHHVHHRSVDSHINRVRRGVEGGGVTILSSRGRGYKLVLKGWETPA